MFSVIRPRYSVVRPWNLAWSLRDARDAPIVTSTVPSVGVGYTDTGEDVVWPDWAAIARLGEGIRTGTLGEAVAQ